MPIPVLKASHYDDDDEVSWDVRTTYRIYRQAAESPFASSVAGCVNTLVDDDPFVGTMLLSWFSSVGLAFLMATDDEQQQKSAFECWPNVWSSLFRSVTVWVATESMLKLIVRKPRPPQYLYHTASRTSADGNLGRPVPPLQVLRRLSLQPKAVQLPGDQYAYPSGHTVRAFALARMLGKAAAGSVLPSSAVAAAMVQILLLLLATSIAWGRIALGKHSLYDVVAGAGLGILFADWIEPTLEELGMWHATFFVCLGYYTVCAILCIADILLWKIIASQQRKGSGNNADRHINLTFIQRSFGHLDVKHQLSFVLIQCVTSWMLVLFSSITDCL